MGGDWASWLRWGRSLGEGVGRAFGHESARLLLASVLHLAPRSEHLALEAAANREALLEQAREFRGECWESLRRRGDEEVALRESLAQCQVDLSYYSNLHLVLLAALSLLVVGIGAGTAIGAKLARPDEAGGSRESTAPEESAPLQVRVRNGRRSPDPSARYFRLGGLL
jgi:hypothetical protein